MTLGRYLKNIGIGVDQLLNTILAGYPDETISSRCGKRILANKCLLCASLCWVLRKIDPDHCIRSIEHDEGRPL